MSLTYRPNDDALLASVYGVDPALLGAVMGPSQTSAVRLANTLALRKAVTWAAANGHHVLINGILECEIPTSGTNLVSYGSYSVGVTLPSGTTIRGADALSSRIAWFPDNTDLTIFFLIDARAAQRKVQFIDFEMRAPPTVVASTLRTYSVYHIGATSSSYTDLVRNRGMLYTGGAYSLFNSSFGNGTIEHLDTIFSGGFLGTECYGSDLAKFFHARNTKFTNSADHAVYIHPSISFNVEGCEFNTVGYYAWHNYGVSPTLAPQYQIFRGNHVASTCTRGIITGKLGEVLVEHNVFENGEISMYGDARIIGNRFSGAGSAINIAGGHSNHQRMLFQGNRVTFAQSGSYKAISQTYTNSEYAILDNYFELTGADGNGVISLEATGGRALVERNWFAGSCTANVVWHKAATARIHRNIFNTLGSSAVIVQSNAVTDCDISENQFLYSTDNRAIHTYQLLDGVIRGHDNEYAATSPFNVETPGGHTYQRLRGSERLSPNTVASGASITLPINYGVFHVTGVTTIDTMLRAGAVDATRMHEGAITLIFDSTAATSNAGNIYPKSVAARTANTAARFVFDPSANKWVES